MIGLNRSSSLPLDWPSRGLLSDIGDSTVGLMLGAKCTWNDPPKDNGISDKARQ